ncbi:SPOR domain-containing protein [Marinomonas posidonica]|uniref:Sporulation domain-containing protein n=1 Tax=Marinomonas posidonica (strain CECT 7376 / NCIMB 14433 / IVIA-Po-181) TaxID=491952 RepID=F6CVI5_MARPP|nr:SPOR domain-containing protein [Marinomonas posidonica]AEF55362.1 Sporulation domain-containing protein [Marinomonas posidonica IVIA-Po-181]
MGITKKLVVVQMGLVLAACSSTGGNNTFMTYEDLQTKVRMHDEQWQAAQVKLDKIDALEAEVASLKQEKLALEAAKEMPDATESTMIDVDDSMAATNVAPAVETSTDTMASMEDPAETMSASMSTEKMSSETMPAAPLAGAEQNNMNMAQAAPLAATNMSQSSTKSTNSTMADDGYGVQLAAYSNRDEAVRGWQVLMKRDPTAYNGLVPKINQKEVKGRTMYQLKVGPFLQKSFSVDFCMMLKEKGKDCLVNQYNGESF